MKNKKISILLIIVVIITIFSISVFAAENVKKMIGPPVVEYPTDEEIREAALKEREEYLTIHQDEDISLVEEYSLEKDIILQEKRNKAELETKERDKVIKSVMNRLYPNEFPALLEKLQTREYNSYNLSELTKEDYQYYNLLLGALEGGILTEEETAVLKDYITDQITEIRKDTELQKRFENLGL